jgi:ribosome-binding protein aMBF1 (putative translation factor)
LRFWISQTIIKRTLIVNDSQMKTAILIHPGEILADELEARGWTQKQLAELIQKSPQEVSFIIT